MFLIFILPRVVFIFFIYILFIYSQILHFSWFPGRCSALFWACLGFLGVPECSGMFRCSSVPSFGVPGNITFRFYSWFTVSPSNEYQYLISVSDIYFLIPTTTVHSQNTRNSTKLNFYRPQVRTNIGKFTFKYSASVMWEAVPLALKKANTFSKFKKLYKAHLISCQSANICFV